MTISTDTASATYTGNGTTAIFPIPFYFLVDTDIKVTRKSAATGLVTTLVLNSDYTLTGAGVQAGGSLTSIPALPNLDQIFIERNVVAVQQTAYPVNSPFPAASHERALDRLTMLAQQILSKLSFGLFRNPLTASYDAGGGTVSNIADAVGAHDATSLAQVQALVTGAASGILPSLIVRFSDLIVAAGAALIGFIQAGTGAVARTLQAKQREVFSVTDFGADPTGVADSSAAIRAAVAAAIAAAAGGPSAVTIVWPAGTYKYTGAGFVQPRWVTHVAAGVVYIDATGLTAGAIFCDVQNAAYTLPTATIGAFSYVWDGKGGGFTIKGNGGLFSSQGTSAGLRMGEVTASGNVLLHCRDTGTRNTQFIQFYEGLRITPVNFYLCQFDDTTFNACYYDVHVVGTANNAGENVRFNGCIFTQAKRPISLQASMDFRFTHCSFDFNNDCVVYFEGTTTDASMTFSSCHLECTSDRLAMVAGDNTIGSGNRVLFVDCEFAPSTFTSASGTRWGDTFPTTGNRADGQASFIKWVAQPTTPINVQVRGGAARLAAWNCALKYAFDPGGYCSLRGIQFPYTVKGPPGYALAANKDPTFTGATNTAALATQGYSGAGTGTVSFSTAFQLGTDPVSIAVVISGTQVVEVTCPKMPVRPQEAVTSEFMFYGNTTTGGAAYMFVSWYDLAGNLLKTETAYSQNVDTIYNDTAQPGYTGNRAHWIRWPASTTWTAPPGAASFTATWGLNSVVGTSFIARPSAYVLG